jgi:hypothetical protein
VKDKFLLVELDFPRDHSKNFPQVMQRNQEWAALCNVQGYPSIILTDARGRPYAKTGYQGWGTSELPGASR